MVSTTLFGQIKKKMLIVCYSSVSSKEIFVIRIFTISSFL